jgi:peptidase A4-like protein
VAGRRLAAVIAIVLGVAGCGGRSDSDRALYSFGHMTGYVWEGHVTAVAGSWSVPRMSGAGEAHASTWIGAQAPGVPHRSPFIQVGIVEDRGAHGPPAYGAFWTDTVRGFHPRILFRVQPGDLVSTALTLTAGRWRVHVVDATSLQSSSFTTSEEGTGRFNLAEWLQEDPIATTGKVTRYPDLSQVSMSALTVNGARPRYADMFAQWMSLAGHDLAPTPLRDGTFTITSAALTAAGKRYLKIAHAQQMAARRVNQQAAHFTVHTSAGEIERVSAAAAASERHYLDGLERVDWPAAARAPIRALMRALRVEAGLFASAAGHAPASLAAWRRQFVELNPAILRIAHLVHRALHVPEAVFGPLSTASGQSA